jgi:UDP-N-acetylglucosamine 4,6-dehydratase
MFNNKNILITGGTGSFGNLFVETILRKFKPKKLIIFSRDELKQSVMNQKFPKEKYKCIRYFIGDVRDQARLQLAMQDVDYVVHAAALKQVDVAEYNPMECVKTNIGGAENVVKAAMETNVSKVIALSTDKASDPINLYGATKLTSDKIFVSSNNIVGEKRDTKFSVVRYGNVAGSRGSVIPIFKHFISEGKKELPITDEKMTRFWITLEQSVDFVLKSFERMQGGEIFVPKIPSIRIVDLAKAMAPKLNLKIVGIRPGEKMHEKLCSIHESHLTLKFKDHYLIQPSIVFFNKNEINYSKNKLKEVGKLVRKDFEYRSDNNEHFLTRQEIIKLNKRLK